MRTADVARASGYSLQQVRDLERLGVIPPAARAGNGYRAYGPMHVVALRAYRALAFAAGPVVARQVLAGVWRQSMPDAAAAIGDVHVRLARQRDEVLQARRALAAIRAEAGSTHSPPPPAAEDRDALSITELAGALDVRTSTLRFWEQEGLVHPDRITSLRARHYAPHAVREARIVAALRRAGYGIPAVRELMGALGHADGLGEADRILQVRLDGIAARSVALLRAGSDLAEVLAAIAGDAAGHDASRPA
ncbi:MerR family transcriptional regulator [Agromyces mariniharenae]|uniref:MerR family transcriptional regulator n=1 Tax=Agromyces mariniharenae TaxID=2604423 RepID=A0A5S4UWE9_9MICO|nr:MerR family transcriptional regulator [Agromyces mariniharenae]